METEKKITDVFVTTIDNPYDPFKEFDKWMSYDDLHGHHTCSLLSNYLLDFSGLPEDLQVILTEFAIDNFLKNDVEKKYKKVFKFNE